MILKYPDAIISGITKKGLPKFRQPFFGFDLYQKQFLLFNELGYLLLSFIIGVAHKV